MTTAFQRNAFQNNSWQMDRIIQGGDAGGYSYNEHVYQSITAGRKRKKVDVPNEDLAKQIEEDMKARYAAADEDDAYFMVFQ